MCVLSDFDQTARNIPNDHPSTFKVQMRNYCAPHYYDAANGCNVFCAPKEDSNFDCDKLTGEGERGKGEGWGQSGGMGKERGGEGKGGRE